MPTKFRMHSSSKKRGNSVRFKKPSEPPTSSPPKTRNAGTVSNPTRRRRKPKIKARVIKVDERPRLHTRPARREPPNPVPTPPRKPRQPQKPQIGPVNTADLLTPCEHFDLVNKLENLGSARTPNETVLLKKLKRWKKQ